MSPLHRRTDPACRRYRPPGGRLGWWWFDRHRGRSCLVCLPHAAAGDPDAAARARAAGVVVAVVMAALIVTMVAMMWARSTAEPVQVDRTAEVCP